MIKVWSQLVDVFKSIVIGLVAFILYGSVALAVATPLIIAELTNNMSYAVVYPVLLLTVWAYLIGSKIRGN
jgi:hypothetical protein